MIRVVGLLLLVSGLASTLLLAAVAGMGARPCSPLPLGGESFLLPNETQQGTRVLLVKIHRQLTVPDMEGFRYFLRLSTPERLEVHCLPPPPPNVTGWVGAPKLVNITVEEVTLYILRPSDLAVVEAALTSKDAQPTQVLALLERKALKRVKLAEAQEAAPTWGATPWGRILTLEGWLDVGPGDYSGVLVVSGEAAGGLSNCTARAFPEPPRPYPCKAVAPTPSQYARGLLVALLGLLLLAYDLQETGALAKLLGRLPSLRRTRIAPRPS
ncbi:MAG: hypothetical protein ACP5II_06915 [Infirmifilum sp.]|uniref:hypothetical protein n=1 Tax=Infirmifilum sp. TaxID=2856575 RepID=UPI003D0EE840